MADKLPDPMADELLDPMADKLLDPIADKLPDSIANTLPDALADPLPAPVPYVDPGGRQPKVMIMDMVETMMEILHNQFNERKRKCLGK